MFIRTFYRFQFFLIQGFSGMDAANGFRFGNFNQHWSADVDRSRSQHHRQMGLQKLGTYVCSLE